MVAIISRLGGGAVMTGILEKGEWLPIVWFLSLVDFGYDGTEDANTSRNRSMKAVLKGDYSRQSLFSFEAGQFG